ncbi:signal recognition particle-docking protein FtsY [Capilliphycus salinus ALCB114379]|uniref:signal recognition particle-docking protein FtsY n=1 Tax=Capilliphycus salinus TaxID=2768948 RepID=UPI0039A507F4
MVFNWFRRQFDTSGSTSKSPEKSADTKPSEDQQAEPQPAESEQSTAKAPTQTNSADEYLQWAKTAYQNLQTQQKPEPDEVEPPPTPEPELEPTTALNPPPEAEATGVEAVTEAETWADPEIGSLVSQDSPELTSSYVPEVSEPMADVSETESSLRQIPTPETEVRDPEDAPEAPETAGEASDVGEVTTPAAAAPLPIWAQSQADRQARIERLKETAQEEPEPVGPAAAVAIAQESAIAFDEMFMWSAEVLANQGRRPEDVAIEEITWLQKLWRGLGRTRRSLLNQLKAIVGQGPLNQEAVEEIESLLLQADVGIEATETIISALQEKIRAEVLPPEQAIAYLKQLLRELLERPYENGYSPAFAPEKETLNIWLITGVNGAGKTTTIGKIGHIARKSDYNCLIAAADTFRAAAVEQVKVWGQRSGVDVIANPGKNTDPAAVVFDAIEAAKARNTELLLVDTAGRLQNKKNLMEELSKVRRVIDKKAPDAIVESLLVLDATLGQNGLRQAEVFAEAAQLSGVVLTKLDGTAKGGVALAIVQQLGLPIRFIGVGESIEDLRPFSSYEFIEALLSG